MCPQLKGNTHVTFVQVNGLRSKLEEASANVKRFEQRFQKQARNEEHMKTIVAQLRDYLFLSDEENVKLKDQVEKLKEEIDTLQRDKADKEEIIEGYKGRENECKEKISWLKDAMKKKEEESSCACEEQKKIYEATIKELKNEKSLLEDKVRNCSLADERSEKIVELTEKNKRMSQAMDQLQERLGECCNEKAKFESDLQLKTYQLNENGREIAALRRRIKTAEDKIEAKDQQIATLTQKLRLCERANEIADIERRKSEEDTSSANALIGELERKISLQKTCNDKCTNEIKRQHDEITKLELSNKAMKTGLNEMRMDNQALKSKLGECEAHNGSLARELKEEQENRRKVISEFEQEKKCLQALQVKLCSVNRDAERCKEENRALVHKVSEANKLMAESKQLSESKMHELEKLFEDYKCMAQKVNALKIEVAQKGEMLEACENGRKQENEEASKTVQRLKKAVKHLHKENKKNQGQLSAFEQQRSNLQKEVEFLDKGNTEMNERLATMKHDLEDKENENAALHETITNHLAKITDYDILNKTLKRSLGKMKTEKTAQKKEIETMMSEREHLLGAVAAKDEKIDNMSQTEGKMRSQIEKLQTVCDGYKGEIERLKEAEERNSALISNGKEHVQALIDEKKDLMSRLNEKEVKLQDSRREEQRMKENLDTARRDLEIERAQKNDVLKECDQLNKANQESISCIRTLESNLIDYSKKVSSLEEANSKLTIEKNALQVEVEDIGKEHQRICEKEKEMKHEIKEKEQEIVKIRNGLAETQKALKEQYETSELLRDQLDKSEQEYKKLEKDYETISCQKDACTESMKEAEVKLERIMGELETEKAKTANLSAKLEAINESHEEIKKKYIKRKNEKKKSGKSIKELKEYAAKLEQENEGLNFRIHANQSRIKEIEESYKAEKFNADCESKGQEETIDILKNELAKREKDLESLGQEYKAISTEMLKMKMTYSDMLKDAINQRYLIGELTGSHQYEHVQRKKLQKEVDSKDEELLTLRKKLMWYEQELSTVKGLFDGERGLRLQMDKDIRRLKTLYEELEQEKLMLVDTKEEIERESQKKISQLRNCLQNEKSMNEEIKVELEEKNKSIEDILKEFECQKNASRDLETKLNTAADSLRRESDRVKDLERRLHDKLSKMEEMAKTIEEYKNMIVYKESRIDSMHLKLGKKEQEKTELDRVLALKEKENKALEKEKISLERRIKVLEESIKEAEKRYLIKDSEECELRESLKNARCEYRKLLEEKEEVEETKHVLQLKLLQSGVEKSSKDCSKQKSFLHSMHASKPNSASTKIEKTGRLGESDPILDQVINQKEDDLFRDKYMKELPSVFDDLKVKEFRDLIKSTNHSKDCNNNEEWFDRI